MPTDSRLPIRKGRKRRRDVRGRFEQPEAEKRDQADSDDRHLLLGGGCEEKGDRHGHAYGQRQSAALSRGQQEVHAKRQRAEWPDVEDGSRGPEQTSPVDALIVEKEGGQQQGQDEPGVLFLSKQQGGGQHQRLSKEEAGHAALHEQKLKKEKDDPAPPFHVMPREVVDDVRQRPFRVVGINGAGKRSVAIIIMVKANIFVLEIGDAEDDGEDRDIFFMGGMSLLV